MMWAGALLCFIVFGIKPNDFEILTLAIALVIVVLITSTFEIYQEGKQADVIFINLGNRKTKIIASQQSKRCQRRKNNLR